MLWAQATLCTFPILRMHPRSGEISILQFLVAAILFKSGEHGDKSFLHTCTWLRSGTDIEFCATTSVSREIINFEQTIFCFRKVGGDPFFLRSP